MASLIVLCLLPGAAWGGAGRAAVAHDFVVDIKPDRGELRVEDRITLPTGVTELVLTGAARELNWDPPAISAKAGHGRRRLLVPDSPEPREVVLEYVLPVPAPQGGKAGAGVDSVVLDGAEPWYPDAPGRMLTFTLTVTTPAGWQAVSQGGRLDSEIVDGMRRVVWRETQPQPEVHLVAAPFTEYLREAGGLRLMAFLRKPDQALADRYLDLAPRYIGMYEELIGEYPYAKFALVENTWESGLGMPSFTLLGPRVIRLPFIPFTSYPHEILHNWWGNSVYVDYSGGNWSEGLTSYLADHRLKAKRGQGARYRRDALQKYRSFVSSERDFPLARFRARHGEASQAVGYNKGLMLFHMLRRHLGDRMFFAGLQRFYQSYRFKQASFTDLRQTFEQVSGAELEWFFDQWVERTGAPALALDDVELLPGADGFTLRGLLRQTQAGAVYRLKVPIRVANDARRLEIAMTAREQRFEVALAQRPASVTVDPDFDVFRKLDAGEVPATLGAAFGAARLTFVVPREASDADREAYRAFAAPWRGPEREVRIVTDRERLPQAGAVWLLGWGNARRPLLEDALRGHGVAFQDGTLTLAGERYQRSAHAVTLAARNGEGQSLLWTHAADTDPGGMARRLRHYNPVSYVAFKGGEPVARGQWPVVDSPLTARLRRPYL